MITIVLICVAVILAIACGFLLLECRDLDRELRQAHTILTRQQAFLDTQIVTDAENFLTGREGGDGK